MNNLLFEFEKKICVTMYFSDAKEIHLKFKVCNSYNSNNSPTRCNNFPVNYPDVYLHPNMFRAFPRPSSGAQ
jgi:hypothetical protein